MNNQSGTTTDAIDTDVEDKEGRKFTLIDTAGIRKRAKARSGRRRCLLVVQEGAGVCHWDNAVRPYGWAWRRTALVVMTWGPPALSSAAAQVAKADNGTEELSVERALRAMRRADVVAIVIDAMLGATEQDYRIAERAALNGCAMVRMAS